MLPHHDYLRRQQLAGRSVRVQINETDVELDPAGYPGPVRLTHGLAGVYRDPVDDSLVPSLWMAKLTAQVRHLQAGQRLLIDRGALTVLDGLRAHPNVDPARHPIDGGNQELEWLLREIDRRFGLRPVYRDPDGLIVAELSPRAA